MTATTNLNTVLKQVWHLLEIATKPGRHPFTTPVLGSQSDIGPALRTLILRHVSPTERLVMAHTDIRSAKVAQIRQNPQVSWLFYNSQTQIQIRLSGSAHIHHQDVVADEQWSLTPVSSRRNYLTVQEPGTVLAEFQSNLPPFVQEREPTLAESEAGRPYFAVIVGLVESIDWLELAYTGHQRARFMWQAEGWQGRWLAV